MLGDVRFAQGLRQAFARKSYLLGRIGDCLAVAGHHEIDRGRDLFEMRLSRSKSAGRGVSSSTARARLAGDSFMPDTVGPAAWWGNALKRHVPRCPFAASRSAASAGSVGGIMVRPITAIARAADADSLLRRGTDLSSFVYVEVLGSGQDLEPRRWVMCEIPLDLQRKFERRWAARFAQPAPSEKART
jgi:hypothetical protein